MAYILPAAVYQSPPRQSRGRQLNTIMEEKESFSGAQSESGTESDRTVIGRPAAWDPKHFVAAQKRSRLGEASPAESPVGGIARRRSTQSVQSSIYDGSEDGTVFSESCPSLDHSVESDLTSFATESARDSLVSSASGKNRYPGLIIPRPDSWASMTSSMKNSPIYKDSPTFKNSAHTILSPSTRIPLSPAVLSGLPRYIPAITATPSLGDGSSIASQSPSLAAISAPCTPDMRIVEGESWGGHHPGDSDPQSATYTDLGDDILPPPNVFDQRFSRDWSDIVVHFPAVPGATPVEQTPVTPNVPRRIDFPSPREMLPSEDGIQLPPVALATLQGLFGGETSDTTSESNPSEETEKEMQEIAVFEAPNLARRRSLEAMETPLSSVSTYSFSELSIPSPGGFFSSLKAGSRHTWCLGGEKKPSPPPSSATAENFYAAPWNSGSRAVETVLEVDENTLPDEPPTVRQVDFGPPTARLRVDSSLSTESDDMYGPALAAPTKAGEIRYEYEEAYEDEIKHAALANVDRTGSWLAAQTTYMSALRETNPVNDVSERSNPIDLGRLQTASIGTPPKSASVEAFFDQVKHIAATQQIIDTPALASLASPAPNSPKDPIFHQAFRHLSQKRKRRDAFFHATPRADHIQSLRITQPEAHVASLLGQLSITTPTRPKYSGPFSQNPRQTGTFDVTPTQAAFREVERQTQALDILSPTAWSVEALRYMYGGRLFAAPDVAERLTTRATVPLSDPACVGRKRMRVLDLGGNTSGDWSWHVATKWANVKVYTVIQQSQAQAGMTSDVNGPPNHRSVSVPHLWALPFRENYFDVISARSLHVLLKSEPVPGHPEIDEYDLALKECMRVLKPGGTLEWLVMDSTIKGAGPRGEAMGVEFGFKLKQRGYEREATRGFLGRVKRAGFHGCKRAWIFLPMGTGGEKEGPAPEGSKKTWREAPRPISEVSDVGKVIDRYLEMEAVQGPVGSTHDVADLSGLLGASMWESWLVKLGVEMGKEREKLLDGVAAVLEEGSQCGAGWRVLSGWAKKPRATRAAPALKKGGAEMGTIKIRIQE